MSTARKIWSASWRLLIGGALLLWIVHSIFVNEAREEAKAARLIVAGERISFAEWQTLPRTKQWKLGWRHGPPALWTTLRSVGAGPLALSIAVMGCTIAVGIARWRMVLNVQGLGLPFARAAEISLVAHFFNSFLLGTVGGDVMKAYYAARETHHKKTEAVVTVFVDRVVGFWAMLLFASFMIVPNLHLFAQPNLLWNVAGLLVLGTLGASAFVFLAFRGGVSKKWSGARDLLRRLPKADIIERSLDSCREFGKERGFLVRTVGLSMLMNFLCVLQFFILARGLRIDVSLLELCLIVPTIICASALPVSIAGIGVREYLMVHLLAVPAIDADRTGALSLALLAFAGSIAWSLVGGVVYVLFREKHHLAEAELARNEG